MTSSTKICVVCGDKALGLNFSAITCESCKAFFRRNALLKKKLICPFNQNCEITIITRRFCQRCRLQKCFKNGMNKGHIMSDEDKKLKKHKIEQNRVKRKLNKKTKHKKLNSTMTATITEETSAVMEHDDYDGTTTTNSSNNTNHCGDDDDDDEDEIASKSDSLDYQQQQQSIYMQPRSIESLQETPDTTHHQPTSTTLTTSMIVDLIVRSPNNSSNAIDKYMKSPTEALKLMENIINTQKDAMKLISHLILYPSDALKIISKVMNSPFDALTVFTKFMSSPTDSIEIISKVANSPGDVLKFLKQLMSSPGDAIDIMNKFMEQPAEALKIINQMVVSSDSEDKQNSTTLNYDAGSNVPIEDKNLLDSFMHSVQNTIPNSTNEITSNSTNTSSFDHALFEESDNNFGKCIESLLTEAIKLEYEVNDPVIQNSCNDKKLTEIEAAKLSELKLASLALLNPVDVELSNSFDSEQIKCEKNAQDPQLLKVINLTAVAIRRLIKMSKKINAFRNMCQEDQIALLKGGCIEMMLMRSVMSYDCDRATWKIPHSQEDMSNIRVDVLKLAKGTVYEEHELFIQTFDPKWRQDENIILIMCAIVLFTPFRLRVVHADVIKLEQNSYYYLLRRYLESIYPGCEAKSTFLKLIQKINEVAKLNTSIIGVYLNVNPSQIEPLLREIFDLKNY